MPKSKEKSEDEYLAEAERLAALTLPDQKEILNLHRSVSQNAKVPKKDRRAALARVEALERHLRRLNKKEEKS